MSKRQLAFLAACFVGLDGLLGGAYLLAWPVPIEPEAWDAPPFEPGAWTPTGTLAGAQRVELPDGHGPEDVEVLDDGRIVAGLQDGRLLVWTGPAAAPTELLDTGGRPLGLDRDLAGNLVVADAHQGLLRIDAHGHVEVLTTTCGGRVLGFPDDVEVAPDGTLWFSDASERFGQEEWKLDLLENKPNGRLCAWREGDRDAEEALGGLYFANGVAVDPEGRFVLVNETSRYRVRKLWIAGDRAGTHEVILSNLPGFPDGISRGTDGRYWIAIASPRNPLVDMVSGSPWQRKVMVRLPAALHPAPQQTARAIAIDEDGAVLHDLYDPSGADINLVTSVQERQGWLYLGSLADTGWARVPVPRSPTAPPPRPGPSGTDRR